MLVKAIVSAVDVPTNSAELTLPEYENVVTAMTPFYKDVMTEQNKNEWIGKWVVLAVFGEDFNDGVIL